MRWSLTKLVEDNQEKVQGWIDDVAMTYGPKDALDIYIKLLEFAVPKLSRAEVSVEDGGKTHTAQMTMAELQDFIRNAPRPPIEGECEEVKDDSR